MSHDARVTRDSSPILVSHHLGSQTQTAGTSQPQRTLFDRLSEPERAQSSSGHGECYQGTSAGIRAYVKDIDTCIESYRAGRQSKFDVISTIAQLLGEDDDLSGEERSQSLELYLAEINSIQTSSRQAEKRKASEGPPTARQRLAGLFTD